METPDPDVTGWERRRIRLAADEQRVGEIADGWRADAGWVVVAITPDEQVEGHDTHVIEVAVPPRA